MPLWVWVHHPPPTQIPLQYDEELGNTVGVGVQIQDQEVEQLLLDESLWYRKRVGEKSEVQFIGGASGTEIRLSTEPLDSDDTLPLLRVVSLELMLKSVVLSLQKLGCRCSNRWARKIFG